MAAQRFINKGFGPCTASQLSLFEKNERSKAPHKARA
jgi:hypothetical protein